MGKAAVDLPDSLDTNLADDPTPPRSRAGGNGSRAPGAGADDILAQLAGDEIDRLLAEADVEKSASLPAVAPGRLTDDDLADLIPVDAGGDLPPAAAGAAPIAPAAPAMPPPISVSAVTPTAAKTTAAAASAPAVQNELDALFDQLSSQQIPGTPASSAPAAEATPADEPAAMGVAPTAAPQEAVAPAATPFATEPVAPATSSLDEELVRTAKQLLGDDLAGAGATAGPSAPTVAPAHDDDLEAAAAKALGAAVNADLDEATPVAPAELPDASDLDADPPPLPIYLRPLAWMNAPFEALPDRVRETLGKVALVTLFNAIAVLVYVLVFRGGK